MVLMNPIAVVATSSHSAAVPSRLEKALGCEVLRCSIESVRARLGPHTRGVLVLVASEPTDAAAIRLLVQEIRLRRWPVTVLLLDTPDSACSGPLAELGLYVAGRLKWPTDEARLMQWVRELSAGCSGFAAGVPTAEESLAQRLTEETPSLAPLAGRLTLVAMHDITVLLTGETGTGKTYLARLMHDSSPRRRGPFVTVPCGAIPSELLESTFFGHVKGSFTGADRDRQGRFAAAAGGTLLLDEIDTLPLAQQASLLRVIETGEFEPIGSNQTVKSSARLIAASNWDLEKAVAERRFREDLYYRLNILSFYLPPLRERVGDIAHLVRGMATRFAARFHKDLFDISPEAMTALESRPWPGNIRQLEHDVQQAVLCSNGPVLLPTQLPTQLPTSLQQPHHLPEETDEGLQQELDSLERSLIQRALRDNGGNRARAARALGISRATLYKKIKKYRL
jgi:transcriptional regulator with PAS, ATPase and Fis domain